tara:strand:- start:197 stop:1054 length:858 start_codon:yes stop_codon:yes gene_type:complete
VPNILLTGSTGFIGSNILKNISKDNKVYVTLRKNSKEISVFNNKIKTLKFENFAQLSSKLKKIKIDIVIHAATHYVKKHKENDIKKLGESNIFFGNVILENIQVMKVKKFINFSTVWEGKNENKNMKNLYAAYKKSFGLILNFYKEKYPKIKFYELMLSDTFGENDNRPKIINTLKKNFYAGKITNVVSKNLYLNLLNVNDIVEAVNIILKKKVKPDKYVLKNTKYFNIFNLIQLFNKKNDKKIKVKWLSKKILKNKIFKYKKLKNWQPYKSDIEDIINSIKIKL